MKWSKIYISIYTAKLSVAPPFFTTFEIWNKTISSKFLSLNNNYYKYYKLNNDNIFHSFYQAKNTEKLFKKFELLKIEKNKNFRYKEKI